MLLNDVVFVTREGGRFRDDIVRHHQLTDVMHQTGLGQNIEVFLRKIHPDADRVCNECYVNGMGIGLIVILPQAVKHIEEMGRSGGGGDQVENRFRHFTHLFVADVTVLLDDFIDAPLETGECFFKIRFELLEFRCLPKSLCIGGRKIRRSRLLCRLP